MKATQGLANEHHDELEQYEFRLKGHLDARWITWLEGQSLFHESDGTTTIIAHVVDQPALHGVLRKIRDLGVPLVAVNQLVANEHNHAKKEETNP
ncbi:hypothetical protein [Paenibacillus koleovorans]|uniref:hypothetical protein n=1 Tax=Paenibacillus koleovorans TaxID=121608 RepID=UPI000FD9A017|nr:hypothetical protein [Paenibacillus koleovorans]